MASNLAKAMKAAKAVQTKQKTDKPKKKEKEEVKKDEIELDMEYFEEFKKEEKYLKDFLKDLKKLKTEKAIMSKIGGLKGSYKNRNLISNILMNIIAKTKNKNLLHQESVKMSRELLLMELINIMEIRQPSDDQITGSVVMELLYRASALPGEPPSDIESLKKCLRNFRIFNGVIPKYDSLVRTLNSVVEKVEDRRIPFEQVWGDKENESYVLLLQSERELRQQIINDFNEKIRPVSDELHRQFLEKMDEIRRKPTFAEMKMEEKSRVKIMKRFIYLNRNKSDEFNELFRQEVRRLMGYRIEDIKLFGSILSLLRNFPQEKIIQYLSLFCDRVDTVNIEVGYSITAMLEVVQSDEELNSLFSENMSSYGSIEELIKRKSESYMIDYVIEKPEVGVMDKKQYEKELKELDMTKKHKPAATRRARRIVIENKGPKVNTGYTAPLRYPYKQTRQEDYADITAKYSQEDKKRMARAYILSYLKRYFNVEDAAKLEKNFFSLLYGRWDVRTYLQKASQLIIYLDDEYLASLATIFKYRLEHGYYSVEDLNHKFIYDEVMSQFDNRNVLFELNIKIQTEMKRFVDDSIKEINKPIGQREHMKIGRETAKDLSDFERLKLSMTDCKNVTLVADKYKHEYVIYKEYHYKGSKSIQESFPHFRRDELLRSDDLLNHMPDENKEEFLRIVREEMENRNMVMDYVEYISEKGLSEEGLFDENIPYEDGNDTYLFNKQSLYVFFKEGLFINPYTGKHFTRNFINKVLNDGNMYGYIKSVEYEGKTFELDFLRDYIQTYDQKNVSQNWNKHARSSNPNENIVNPYTGEFFERSFVVEVLLSTRKIEKECYFNHPEIGLIIQSISSLKEQFKLKDFRIPGTQVDYSVEFVRFITESYFENENDIVYYKDLETEELYCFQLQTLLNKFLVGNKTNPYTGRNFSDTFLANIGRYHKASFTKKKKMVESELKEKYPEIRRTYDTIDRQKKVEEGVNLLVTELNMLDIRAMSSLKTKEDKLAFKLMISSQQILEGILKKSELQKEKLEDAFEREIVVEEEKYVEVDEYDLEKPGYGGEVYQPKSQAISEKQALSVRRAYDRLRIRDAKSKNIHRQDVRTIRKNDYTVTNKLDGERFVVMFNEFGIFAFNHRTIEKLSSDRYDGVSVLDTELFDGIFYIFDCMVEIGRNITREKHSVRLDAAKNLCTYHPKLRMKEFMNVTETERLLQTIDRSNNDGIIYTPDTIYNSDEIYKWKFPEKMSIDFKVKRVDSGYQLYDYKSDERVQTDNLFKGSREFPLPEGAVYNGKELKDGSIHEFTYENSQFVWLRERHDKELPNYCGVSINVWNDMNNPFMEEELLLLLTFPISVFTMMPPKPKIDCDIDSVSVKKPLEDMRMYHNNIKSELIDYYCSDATVLDLGFGKGGDLGKYQRANVTELWGIEPDHMNLNECRHRLEQKIFSNIRRRTHLIKARAQDTNLIAKEVGKKVDTVASFFSLSFFFFTEKDLDQLVDTIDATLNVHGFFIGTTIIGEHVRRLLLEHDGKFSFKDGFIMWDDDQEKRVRLSFPGTIVGNQIESLVNFPLLVEKLEQKDINLMAVTDFPPSEYLSEEENTLNSLYAKFVFRRVKPRISAIVVTKLSKNMSSIIQERDFKSMTFKVRDVEDLRKQINRFYNIYNEYAIETEEGFPLTDSDILDSISTKEGINILKVVLIKTSTIDVTFRGQSHTFTVGSLEELKFQVKKHYLISRNFKILNESGSITKDADIIRGYIHVTVKEE